MLIVLSTCYNRKVLGASNRKDSHLESNGYLVSWRIGHYDEMFVKWSIADLPILPQKWQHLVSPSTKKQFGILKEHWMVGINASRLFSCLYGQPLAV